MRFKIKQVFYKYIHQIEGVEFIYDGHWQTFLTTLYTDERFISDTDNERRKLAAEKGWGLEKWKEPGRLRLNEPRYAARSGRNQRKRDIQRDDWWMAPIGPYKKRLICSAAKAATSPLCLLRDLSSHLGTTGLDFVSVLPSIVRYPISRQRFVPSNRSNMYRMFSRIMYRIVARSWEIWRHWICEFLSWLQRQEHVNFVAWER